jgi:hypothetical protein
MTNKKQDTNNMVIRIALFILVIAIIVGVGILYGMDG